MIFKLNKVEGTKARMFQDRHGHPEKKDGKGFSFIFSPVGLGDKITIRCNLCEEEKDITDYKVW